MYTIFFVTIYQRRRLALTLRVSYIATPTKLYGLLSSAAMASGFTSATTRKPTL